MYEIDHVVIAVDDLDTAATSFAEAGFLVTPAADHPFGTSNRLVVFESRYLELIAVTRPDLVPQTGFAAAVATRVQAGRPGLTHIVLATADPEATAGQYPMAELFEFSRPAPSLDGVVRTAAFTLVMLPATDPGFFFCFHHEPAAVWSEGHTQHPNGARRLLAIETSHGFPPASPLEGVVPATFDSQRTSIVTDGEYARFEVGGVEISPLSGAS